MEKTNLGTFSFLVEQQAKQRFIEDSFNQAVGQLAQHDEKSRMSDVDQLKLREWSRITEFRSIKHPLIQDQMRYACESIHNNSISEIDAIPKDKYTIIDFSKGYQNWDEQIFSLSSMVLTIKVMGDNKTESFYIPRNVWFDASVYIRYEYQHAQAFLKVNGADGQDTFFELDELLMLYQTCDNGDDIHNFDDQPVEDGMKPTEFGLFTLFNRDHNLMFVTTY